MSTSGKQSPLAARIAGISRPHDNDNPLWKGPCGDGPNGGITQSMLSRFLSCRERFRLRYVCGLEPHEQWNHRTGYGNMWHACEEGLAAGGDWFDYISAHARTMLLNYPMQQDEITKWFNVCSVQFPEYVRYWREHPDVVNRTPLMQEQVFDVPYTLPSGRVVRLRGKWDSVDEIDSGIYLQENKTKGDVDKTQIERQLTFDLQTMMYLVAVRQYVDSGWFGGAVGGTHSSDHVLGVRYNVVRRPLSGGKGSIRPHAAKATKNKYTPAETEEAFYERLRRDYLAAEPDYWFFRVEAKVSAREIKVFRDAFLDPILEQLCCWYDTISGKPTLVPSYAQNYRTPFGVYSALEEGGATEYDACLATGSEIGLKRVDSLFRELQ